MTKYLAFLFLLLTPSRQISPIYGYGGRLGFSATIAIYSCKRKEELLPLYIDKEGTAPMANPFLTARDGYYYYFTNRPHVQQVIVVNGKVFGTLDLCGGGTE